MAQNPLAESPPSWELLFEMVGITGGTRKREVYAYVCRMITMAREHEKATEDAQQHTITNPAA